MVKKYIRYFLSIILFTALLTVSSACFSLSVNAENEASIVVPENKEPEENSGNNKSSTNPQKTADIDDRGGNLDPFNNDFKYSAIIYNNTNGLPTSEANAIAQTSEGFIWIGSYGGLVRYDGNGFDRIKIDGITGVKSLYTDSQDRLWIGSTNNGVAMMKNGDIRYFGEDDGMVTGAVQAISEDSSGNIYIASKCGLLIIDKDLHVKTIDDDRVKSKNISDVKKGCDGFVYGLNADSNVFTIKDGSIQKYCHSRLNDVVCLLPDPQKPDCVYLSNSDFQTYGRLSEGDTFSDEVVYYTEFLTYIHNMEYIDGQVWLCAGNGVAACELGDLGNIHYLRNIPLTSATAHVMKDYQGNLWFTSNRQGVLKVVPDFFDDIYEKYGMSNDVVNSTCLYDDKLIIATDTGLRCKSLNGSIDDIYLEEIYYEGKPSVIYDSSLTIYDYLDGVRIRCLLCDSHQRLWIATWGKGLYCLEGKKLYQYSNESNKTEYKLSSNYIRDILEKKDGTILAVEYSGVDSIKNDKIIYSYTQKDGINNIALLTAEEGLNNDVFIGSDGNGIYIVDSKGSTQCLGKDSGLTSGAVMRIKKDRTRDIFWIVTGDSIGYMNGDYEITTVTNFPYPNNFDLYQNSKDEMWVLSSDGIYVVPTEQMVKNQKDMTFLHYGIANGLPCVTTANSHSELTDEGDLYICGNTGVTKINIETAFSSSPEIKAVIPYIEADGKRIYPDEEGNFRVSSNVVKLTVYCSVCNYSLSTPKISYRLEGLEQNDTVIDISDLNPFDYTNLSGGEYRFVMKINPPTENDSDIISVTIIKDKAFYEQLWFYIFIIVAGLLLISLFVYLFIHFREKKLKKKHREEMEKKRITTELKTASDIQSDMMPNTFPAFSDRDDFDIYAKMSPAKEVGGDFYDFFLIDDDHLCMIMADVSGKGIPAALFMMSANIILHNFAVSGKTPADILQAANSELYKHSKNSMFVTVWLGIFEFSTGKLTASNAGHEYPVIREPGGKYELYKDKHGFVLGGLNEMCYMDYVIDMKPGSRLFLYTDGLPEASCGERNFFGTERMLDALNENANCSPEQLLDNVRRAVDRFVQHEEQFDDLTMLCFEYRSSKDDSSPKEKS